MWQRRFGSDPRVIGQTISFDRALSFARQQVGC
jgi:hypothetical protein